MIYTDKKLVYLHKNMLKNTDLFQLSLKNPEPLIDDFYVKKGGLIISDNPNSPNGLMKTNRDLLDNITAFRIAKDVHNIKMMDHAVINTQELMQEKGVNYSEFSSFLSIIDVSYSIYHTLSKNEQIEFLKIAIKKYIEMRHPIYLNHGYTATSLQVGKDAKSHKSSGMLGIIKGASILDNFSYSKLKPLNLNSFNSQNKIYILTDKDGKKLFKEILKKYKIDLKWSSGREKKMPDILFKNGSDIYIVEQKHMKELGGGQDKQVTEIINFISYSEGKSLVKVHYVTFLDGLYFNLFTKKNSFLDGKVKNQLVSIKKNLENQPSNYFVNTFGFNKLLKEIKNKE